MTYGTDRPRPTETADEGNGWDGKDGTETRGRERTEMRDAEGNGDEEGSGKDRRGFGEES